MACGDEKSASESADGEPSAAPSTRVSLPAKAKPKKSLAPFVDVTYHGPGLASMEFTAKLTPDRPGGFAGAPVDFHGSVSAIRAGATETVRLLGGDQASFQSDTTWTGEYLVDSVQDDDPKARAE